jgi:hypothetical protein
MEQKSEPLLDFLQSDLPERLYLSLYRGRKQFRFQAFLEFIVTEKAGGSLENEEAIVEALRHYRDHFSELSEGLCQPVKDWESLRSKKME